jgi:hypothetical protein
MFSLGSLTGEGFPEAVFPASLPESKSISSWLAFMGEGLAEAAFPASLPESKSISSWLMPGFGWSVLDWAGSSFWAFAFDSCSLS